MANGEKRLISGVVLTSPNASLGGFNVEVSETEGPMDLSALSVTSEFMDQMDNLSSEEGGFFSMPFSISEKWMKCLECLCRKALILYYWE
ncbi:MAG: hypothetical protein IPN87_07770 [Saprospiraceae bacterium]|nr:hypothetical protein [Candidatus Brachybacter algidus]